MMSLMFRSALCTAAALVAAAGCTFAQSSPTPRTVPFTEDFGSTGGTTAPTGFAGWNGLSGASINSQSAAEGSTPGGNAAIIATGPSGSAPTGGLYFSAPSGNGRIAVASSSNATNGVNQWVLAIDTTGQGGLTLEYDISTAVANARPIGMVAQYRIGSSGTWTSLPAVTGNPFLSGANTTDVTHVEIPLPNDVNNQPVVQIRFAAWRPSSPGGNSSAFSIDNLSVTAGTIDPNLGACCLTSGSCLTNLAADCTTAGGTFSGAGSSCSPNICPQPSGSCCLTGNICTVVSSPAACSPDIGGSNFIAFGSCAPDPCAPPSPVAVQPGDIVYAANNTDATKTLFQVRGINTPSPSIVGGWSQFSFIEYVNFDNAGGTLHSATGNLLGANFGNAGGAGPIYNYATNGSNNAQLLLDQAGFNAFIGIPTNPRLGGFSVSPSNDRIAFVTYDAAAVGVLAYDAGLAPGTGSGAAILGGSSYLNLAYLTTPKGTYATSWVDNDNAVVFVPMGGQNVSVYTLPVSGSGGSVTIGTPQLRVSTIDPGPDAGRFMALAYNPQLIPGYMFASSSAFASSTTTNTLYIIDVSTWTIVKQLNLSGALQSGRDLAIGGDRNLYFSQFVPSGGGTQISKLILDANADQTVSAAEIAALADNTTTAFVTITGLGSPGFNGLDIGIGAGTPPVNGTCCDAAGACTFVPQSSCVSGSTWTTGGSCSPNPCAQPVNGACCNGASCSIQTPTFCSTVGGTYQGDGSLCTPSPCGGSTIACCRGSTCLVITSAACSDPAGTAGAFASSSTTCNSGSGTTPCCYGDYNKLGGIEINDIFDFLNDWFAGSNFADTGSDGSTAPDINSIFDFLNAWFAGGC